MPYTLINLLDLIEIGGQSTCVGSKSGGKERCGNHNLITDVEKADLILLMMGSGTSRKLVRMFLRNLAVFSLCKKNHQGQIEGVVKKWTEHTASTSMFEDTKSSKIPRIWYQTVENLKAELQQAQGLYSSAKTEAQKLKVSLEDARLQGQKAQELAQNTQIEVQRLLAENRSLKTSLTQISQEHRVSNLASSKLEAQVETLLQAKVELSESNIYLRTECAAAEEQVKTIRLQFATMEDVNSKLREDLEKTQQANLGLADTVSNLKSGVQGWKNKSIDLEWQVASLEKRLEVSTTSKDSLRGKLTDLRAKFEASKATEKKLTERNATLNLRTRELEKLQKEKQLVECEDERDETAMGAGISDEAQSVSTSWQCAVM
ncbi:unnamed protein product [Aureobasidium pullulans]|uniref:Uncharacterized protein n=1 Tax=Aureobasidium pullulans TaxID=5580 RepID=A0A4S8X6F0_AURPU|nr:hypothetical protein D6D22_09311 [Aureobasidium pullulans]CAC9886474.1 unnamed protein product [Aureobasidium pullulans]